MEIVQGDIRLTLPEGAEECAKGAKNGVQVLLLDNVKL